MVETSRHNLDVYLLGFLTVLALPALYCFAGYRVWAYGESAGLWEGALERNVSALGGLLWCGMAVFVSITAARAGRRESLPRYAVHLLLVLAAPWALGMTALKVVRHFCFCPEWIGYGVGGGALLVCYGAAVTMVAERPLCKAQNKPSGKSTQADLWRVLRQAYATSPFVFVKKLPADVAFTLLFVFVPRFLLGGAVYYLSLLAHALLLGKYGLLPTHDPATAWRVFGENCGLYPPDLTAHFQDNAHYKMDNEGEDFRSTAGWAAGLFVVFTWPSLDQPVFAPWNLVPRNLRGFCQRLLGLAHLLAYTFLVLLAALLVLKLGLPYCLSGIAPDNLDSLGFTVSGIGAIGSVMWIANRYSEAEAPGAAATQGIEQPTAERTADFRMPDE